MTALQFFRFLILIAIMGLFVLIGILICGAFISHELSTEAAYRHKLGQGWEVEYERDHGSLTAAHAKIAATVVGLVVIGLLLMWLYRLVVSNKRGGTKKPGRRFGSHLERVIYYRRNAFVSIVPGLVGIVAGCFLVVFRVGIFADHANEMVLGIYVFLAGYAGVNIGCWWWTRAKGWHDAVVLIGLLPLVILLIPYVRLIFVAVPMLLPLGMVTMPMILLVVVYVLPDKSGWKERKRWRIRSALSHGIERDA